MAWLLASTILLFIEHAIATPDAQITARAKLHVRQDVDPSVLGWVSSSGASEFSDFRSCDFPATLSRSGSYAQCCGTSSACNFFTSCSVNTVFAESATVSCDNAICNTGVIVSTTGAKSRASFLGCWASSLGTDAFTLVQDVGSAPTGTPTPTPSETSSNSSSRASSNTATSRFGTTTDLSSPTGSDASGTASTGAAASGTSQPLSGMVGLFAGFLALL
ncbi:hypothetical protein K458DRAFT_397335 [Lentithecium fluviatile CBS 122367]|uniref:Extracellular membrane protein CFEM domain-containing protein n=1 Tax=Lentithecium fluviatile CBS 122367 TaxID=1168545 RepID=A0A6G1ID00_9PLEO|nr:hypothetical protein K458DRAFT_397335 [Lentithecium fluviatile CBS 122367]